MQTSQHNLSGGDDTDEMDDSTAEPEKNARAGDDAVQAESDSALSNEDREYTMSDDAVMAAMDAAAAGVNQPIPVSNVDPAATADDGNDEVADAMKRIGRAAQTDGDALAQEGLAKRNMLTNPTRKLLIKALGIQGKATATAGLVGLLLKECMHPPESITIAQWHAWATQKLQDRS